LRSMLYNDYTASITTIVRRSCLERIGGWHSDVGSSQDWAMALDAAAVTEFAFVDRVVAHTRQHPGSMTSISAPDMADRLRVRARVLDLFFADPIAPPRAAAYKAVAYRNVHIGS